MVILAKTLVRALARDSGASYPAVGPDETTGVYPCRARIHNSHHPPQVWRAYADRLKTDAL
jgi:hypothetical protein